MAKSKRVSRPRRVVVYAKKVGRKMKKATIPLALVGGFVPFAYSTYRNWRAFGSMEQMGNHLMRSLLFYNPDNKVFTYSHGAQGIVPILMGWGLHTLANFTGINRALNRAGVPLIRI